MMVRLAFLSKCREYLCCPYKPLDSSDEEDSDAESQSHQGLVMHVLPPQPPMDAQRRRGAKVYGKKTFAPANSAAAAIFAGSSPSGPKLSPVRRALDDVTESLNNIRLDDNNRADDGESEGSSRKGDGKGKGKEPSVPTTRITRSAGTTATTVEDPRLKWLEPLTNEYERDGRHKMVIQKWADIMDEDWQLLKIAESSFAEVYKVTNDEGTSVLKVMALKPPTGPGSHRETAVEVESVISEVMIMDMMAEIPGFLEFKDAHIIEGKPPKSVRLAYETHAAKKGSEFPKPENYHKDQLFLALELGDAGTDVEHFEITTIAQVWDIFLGAVIALTFGENQADFEHRDLHEGNVCVKQIKPASPLPPTQLHKYAYSGLQITLLDYTLSRASQNGITRFRDLESESALFLESDLLQHQMYRRMRAWVIFKIRGLTHKLWNKRRPTPADWKAFTPYTNVIWTYYLLYFITTHYRGPAESMSTFLTETEDLLFRLEPDRTFSEGGFKRAGEILDYCTDKGWVFTEDLSGMGMSSFFDTHPTQKRTSSY